MAGTWARDKKGRFKKSASKVRASKAASAKKYREAGFGYFGEANRGRLKSTSLIGTMKATSRGLHMTVSSKKDISAMGRFFRGKGLKQGSTRVRSGKGLGVRKLYTTTWR